MTPAEAAAEIVGTCASNCASVHPEHPCHVCRQTKAIAAALAARDEEVERLRSVERELTTANAQLYMVRRNLDIPQDAPGETCVLAWERFKEERARAESAEAALARAVADEREACARVADAERSATIRNQWYESAATASAIARAIRERGTA